MDTISKIKAEIERLIKKDNYETFDVPALLEFLDTLEEQAPKGLDEAAEEYEKESLASKFPTRDQSLTKADIIYIFKAGAEWMAWQGETFESVVLRDAGGYPYIPPIEMYDYENEKAKYNPGDKVIVNIRKK